jgi:hypothetical protein
MKLYHHKKVTFHSAILEWSYFRISWIDFPNKFMIMTWSLVRKLCELELHMFQGVIGYGCLWWRTTPKNFKISERRLKGSLWICWENVYLMHSGTYDGRHNDYDQSLEHILKQYKVKVGIEIKKKHNVNYRKKKNLNNTFQQCIRCIYLMLYTSCPSL